MNRRDFTIKAAITGLTIPVALKSQAKEFLVSEPKSNPKVPLGMDAHSVRGMRWKAKALMNYAIELEMETLLLEQMEDNGDPYRLWNQIKYRFNFGKN